jgi:hypothetical protein
MLTGFVMLVMYGADLGFVAFLSLASPIHDLFTGLILVILFHLLVAILLTRLLARFFPVADGRFSTESPNYDRWRAQGVIAIASSVLFDQFLPLFLKTAWFRLFGARLERGVVISGRLVDPPLVTMKAGSALGAEGMILGHHIARDHIVIGRVVVGAGAMIGVRALVMPNVDIGAGATVGAYAVVTSGKRIGAGETWVGIPAAPLNLPPDPTRSTSPAGPEAPGA